MDEEVICVTEKKMKDKSEIAHGHTSTLQDSQAQSQMAIQSRRQALARARQQSDGLHGTMYPNQQKFTGQSIITSVSQNKKRRHRITHVNAQRQQQNKSFSYNALSTDNQPRVSSFVPELFSATNVTGTNDTNHYIEESESSRISTPDQTSHFVLHISEGMDIKKAIEEKRNETYLSKKTVGAMKNVVTLSDSEDEDFVVPTEAILDGFVSSKPKVKASQETKIKRNKGNENITKRLCESFKIEILDSEDVDSTSSQDKKANTIEIHSSREDAFDYNSSSNIKLNPFYIPSEEEDNNSLDLICDDKDGLPLKTNSDQSTATVANTCAESENAQESASRDFKNCKKHKFDFKKSEEKSNSQNTVENKKMSYIQEDKYKKLKDHREGRMNFEKGSSQDNEVVGMIMSKSMNALNFILKDKNESTSNEDVIRNVCDSIRNDIGIDKSIDSINVSKRNQLSRSTSNLDEKIDEATSENNAINEVKSSLSKDDDMRASPIFVEEVLVEAFDILEKVGVKETNEEGIINDIGISSFGDEYRFKRSLEEDALKPAKRRLSERSSSPHAPSIIIEEARPAIEAIQGTYQKVQLSEDDNVSVIVDEHVTSKRPKLFSKHVSSKHPIQNYSLGIPSAFSTSNMNGVIDFSMGRSKKQTVTTTLLPSIAPLKSEKMKDNFDLDSGIIINRSMSPDIIDRKSNKSKNTDRTDVMTKQDKMRYPEAGIKLKKGQLYSSPVSNKSISIRDYAEYDEESSADEKVDAKVHLDMFLKSCGSRLPGQEYLSVRNKLNKYWNQIPSKYTKSTELASFVEMKWALLESDSKTIYVQIRDVMTRLKELREGKYSGTTSSDPNYKHSKEKNEDDPVAGCSGLQSHTTESAAQKSLASESHKRKLRKALQQCAEEIHKLENAEIDFDDEENSVYIMEAKYKKRYMDIYRKLAEYDSKSFNLDRQADKDFKFEESKFPEINTKITKFVNRSKEFPDFIDIKELVKDHGSRMKWSEKQIHAEAEKIFQAVGKKLIRRRRCDEYENSCSYVQDVIDPARNDVNLDSKLKGQMIESKKKIQKVFQEFVDKQNQSKGKELEDNRSESSDISSDSDLESDIEDESLNNDNSLAVATENDLHRNQVGEANYIQIVSDDDYNDAEDDSDDEDSKSYSVEEVSIGSNDSDT